ncbi:MAG TPA: hypothetical protein VFE15_16320 [Marmoricola sp.]|jgi:hypothetical protein|nr:hypothetical protein [Marmoricola sp.]
MGTFGHEVHLALDSIWKVLVAGLVLGAGLPALYAVGIRSLASGAGGEAQVDSNGSATSRAGNPLGIAIAVVIFVIVAYVVVGGILIVIASGQGKDISFNHVIPKIHAT